jgi:hypothetical protein
MTTLLLIIILTLLILLSISGYYLYKFSLIILKIQEKSNDLVDELDRTYVKIDNILNLDLYSDEPKVMEFVQCIKDTRDNIMNYCEDVFEIK